MPHKEHKDSEHHEEQYIPGDTQHKMPEGGEAPQVNPATRDNV